jgi:dodecin
MFDFSPLRLHTGKISGKLGFSKEANTMSLARVTELSATSEISFEDAINEAVARATKTLRGVEGAWVKDMNLSIEDGNIKGYKVNLEVSFQLEDSS